MCHLYATDPDFRLRGQNACNSVSRQSLPHQCLATLSRHVHPRAHTCTHVHPRVLTCIHVHPRACTCLRSYPGPNFQFRFFLTSSLQCPTSVIRKRVILDPGHACFPPGQTGSDRDRIYSRRVRKRSHFSRRVFRFNVLHGFFRLSEVGYCYRS